MRNRQLMMSGGDGDGYSYSPESTSTDSADQGGSMTPAVAGMMVGGSFLNNYMAQRAAEEENRKKMLAQAELAKGEAAKTGADLTGNAMKFLMDAWRPGLTLGR